MKPLETLFVLFFTINCRDVQRQHAVVQQFFLRCPFCPQKPAVDPFHSTSNTSAFHISLLLLPPNIRGWLLIHTGPFLETHASEPKFRQMLIWPCKAVLNQAGWNSVLVAKPICVPPLDCLPENTRWAWEGDESPLASSQLSCRGAPPPSNHALSSSPIPPTRLHSPPTL